MNLLDHADIIARAATQRAWAVKCDPTTRHLLPLQLAVWSSRRGGDAKAVVKMERLIRTGGVCVTRHHNADGRHVRSDYEWLSFICGNGNGWRVRPPVSPGVMGWFCTRDFWLYQDADREKECPIKMWKSCGEPQTEEHAAIRKIAASL